jgi:hypothetical protein
VEVKGKVEKIYDVNAFTLRGEEGILMQEKLLVVKKNNETTLQPGVRVKVTGTVKGFERSSVEKELGMNLNPEMQKEYEGKSYIDADSVTLFEIE